MTSIEPGINPDTEPTTTDDEPGLLEPLHPDDHVMHAVQLLDLGQVLSAQGDQDDLDVRAMCSFLASIAHAQIAQYELMRRGFAHDGLISPDYRGPDLAN